MHSLCARNLNGCHVAHAHKGEDSIGRNPEKVSGGGRGVLVSHLTVHTRLHIRDKLGSDLLRISDQELYLPLLTIVVN